jgi:hypothetical protein
VNEGVNIPPRGQIALLGANFTPGGEVYPWVSGVKLRMALDEFVKNPFFVQIDTNTTLTEENSSLKFLPT